MKILVIQTAFIGDVILSTAVLEKLHQSYPDAQLDFLVRKGNESLVEQHPFLHQVLVWNKKKNKLTNLFKLWHSIRKEKYDKVITLQRYASTGILTAFSGAKERVGFAGNPFSWAFTHSQPHSFEGQHEVERNQSLIAYCTDGKASKPRLYPPKESYQRVKPFQSQPYVCVAPTSVWFTKQFPLHKWVELLQQPYFKSLEIMLLGASSDASLCAELQFRLPNRSVHNWAGKLSLLDSAALMQGAKKNFVNDSSPMHLASATNAPVTAIYCSTLPKFGFYPLSDQSFVIQVDDDDLSCRPCGFHGHRSCPKGHFKCAEDIAVERIVVGE